MKEGMPLETTNWFIFLKSCDEKERRDGCSRSFWPHSCLAFVLLFVWLPPGAVSIQTGFTTECRSTWLKSLHHCRLSVKLDGRTEGNLGGKALAFSEKTIYIYI